MPALLPMLPCLAGLKTYAAWPIWADTAEEVRFAPTPKKAAVRLWHRARDFDRQTRKGNRCHGGAVGPSALQVLHVLIFDFLNFRTGRLDPSYAAIARKANVCERTVATALKRLKELRILNWVRRCTESRHNGQYVREQDTNAYAVLPDGQWRGYQPPLEPPAPAPGTWGDHPSLPPVIAQAMAERRHGGSVPDMVRVLENDPGDRLAAALARLGRAMEGRAP